MSSSEPLAARPFPLARGLVLRNRLVGTAHAAGLVSGGLARPEDAGYWRSLVPSGTTVRVVGDALVPRRVAHAISEGRAAADAIRASRAHMPVTAAPA